MYLIEINVYRYLSISLSLCMYIYRGSLLFIGTIVMVVDCWECNILNLADVLNVEDSN